jgi:large subunit ribosomal protein L32
MAVPQRKTSRSNTRHRRSQWKATVPDLVPVTVDGRTAHVPRRLVKAVQRGLVKTTTTNRSTR